MKNEIKKMIYKEQSKAFITHLDDGYACYMCHLNNGQSITFKIPFSEIGNTFFEGKEMPAKLLIRWIEL